MCKILKSNIVYLLISICFIGFTGSKQKLAAQSEVMAWGNLTGIRIDGQLMEFETSFIVVEKGWGNFNKTGKEKQRPMYKRVGVQQIVTTKTGGISFKETINDNDNGTVNVNIESSSETDTLIEGVFFCIELPEKYYSTASLQFTKPSPSGNLKLSASEINVVSKLKAFQVKATGFKIESPNRQLEVNFKTKSGITVSKDNQSKNIQIFIELLDGKIKKGQKSQNSFAFKATGKIDNNPAELILDVKNSGRKFEGLGGNFRLQKPTTDPQVIQYCLDNLRVAWSRVEMPWSFWQPDENKDPIETANSGNLNPRVDAAMKIAQKLAENGMPVIVSDWSAPDWAIEGDPKDAFRFRSQGIYGYPLNLSKMDKIYKSIGDYLIYLKQNYGVEAEMFSFNESDLGINVRHTGKEHAEFIKGLGKHLASRGLATKLLLGDNSDATTFDFIVPAIEDPETHKYIGAISFHSWRGCDDETLKKWAGAAKKMNLPLIIGEGSTDAAAWNYPDIFSEQSFALYEINLYTRLCAICQPLSILQWQLTADYSVLMGDGIYGTDGPLRPTQRFWNLKQLASTPENSFAIPVACNKDKINCAAFGNIAKGEYAVHIVNNGAKCSTSIKGIPSGVLKFDIYVTDSVLGMKKTGEVEVVNNTATFELHPAGFTTLLSH